MKIFHLATESAWREAQDRGSYTVSTLGLELADVGFIHCSQAEQVADVHDRFYRDVGEPLVLLTIETERLTSPWRLEPVKGEPMPFPHIYGPLDPAAVVAAEPFTRSAVS